MNNSNKTLLNLILGIVITLVVLAIGALGGYALHKATNKPAVSTSKEITEKRKEGTPVSGQEEIKDASTVAKTDDLTNKEEEKTTWQPAVKTLNWQEPAKIASLNFFGADHEDYNEAESQYYDLGTFSEDTYAGSKLILISAQCNFPCSSPAYLRLVKKADNSYILLSKYSFEIDITKKFNQKFTVDKTFSLPELNFPDNLYGPEPRQKLVLDPYFNAFFISKDLKLAFTDPKIGPVYTTADDVELKADNVFSKDGFYVKAADSTVRVYKYEPDFFDPTSAFEFELTFNNDGHKKLVQYKYVEPGACGGANYISAMRPDEINRNTDLRAVGTNNQGDTIFELNNPNNALLKAAYQDMNNYQPDNKPYPTYTEFVKTYPLLFFIDPFGRLIKMESNEFIPAVECGKPVIYLYPEKTTQVTVKVTPKGGFSYTEPAYDGKWEVIADPQGHLIEIKTGKTYPYLFWEGNGDMYVKPTKGFVVERARLAAFLSDKLTLLGLNETERKDFKEFWEPRMLKKDAPYFFVTFFGTTTMNHLAPLEVSPTPDTIIRILMDFWPLQRPVNVEGYKITTPIRKGFTVVEWGGMLR